MDKKISVHTSSESKLRESRRIKESLKNTKGDCSESRTSSHIQIYLRKKYQNEYKRITSDENFDKSESGSGSSDTFHCVHEPKQKAYTEEGELKRLIKKKLDLIQIPHQWVDKCPTACGWEVADCLEFLVADPIGRRQIDRIENYLHDFAETARHGYKIQVLKSLCVVLDYLVENLGTNPNLRKGTILLLKNLDKPILLTRTSDIVFQFDALKEYIGFLGYLLIRLEDDELFKLVSRGVLWQLSAREKARGRDAAQRRHVLVAAPALLQTATRMLALASSHRFPTFLQIALLLACDSVDNSIEMLKENIIENVFYRFNPFFPVDELPAYEDNPADPQDYNVKLGDSSINMPTTLSLLLVLSKTLKNCLNKNQFCRTMFPCPDYYAQRCFIWAYRFECRLREHRHERNCLTVVAHALVHCFGDRLMAFSKLLMPDIMTLSVLTELPPRRNWTGTVSFNTAEADVQFKKLLIYLSVDFLKVIPVNNFMVESQHWLLGLMFLLDPSLCPLRARWSVALFSEIRKTALQALVSTIPMIPPKLIQEYEIIRRIMWYIEWYSESPYELPVLYWCVRLLQVAAQRHVPTRRDALDLCNTLLEQKCPPVEKSQAVVAVCLRVLGSAVAARVPLHCSVYAHLPWPVAADALAARMLAIILHSLEQHLIISDRWLISLLDFIWESIVWKKEYVEQFIQRNGVYNLLDIVSMSKAPVQCLALAILCDVARGSHAVAQLVSWRAGRAASDTYPGVVKRGSTIATLLAAVFRDECRCTGVLLDEHGIIQNMESPLQTTELKTEMTNQKYPEDKSQRTPICSAAATMAGSRASKAFALLQLLSEDLNYKVTLADETYKLYKNIRLNPEDEVILVLCSYYLTIKINETWQETKLQSQGFLRQDEYILNEFLELKTGWAKNIKQEQQDNLEENNKTEQSEESSLYAFLNRVRLNVALDALREVRCAARSARVRRDDTHATAATLATIQTYRPALDEQNVTGQYLKVQSIRTDTNST